MQHAACSMQHAARSMQRWGRRALVLLERRRAPLAILAPRDDERARHVSGDTHLLAARRQPVDGALDVAHEHAEPLVLAVAVVVDDAEEEVDAALRRLEAAALGLLVERLAELGLKVGVVAERVQQPRQLVLGQQARLLLRLGLLVPETDDRRHLLLGRGDVRLLRIDRRERKHREVCERGGRAIV